MAGRIDLLEAFKNLTQTWIIRYLLAMQVMSIISYCIHWAITDWDLTYQLNLIRKREVVLCLALCTIPRSSSLFIVAADLAGFQLGTGPLALDTWDPCSFDCAFKSGYVQDDQCCGDSRQGLPLLLWLPSCLAGTL